MSETYQQVKSTVVEEVAIKLKENYRLFSDTAGTAVPEKGNDQEYRRMAGELIDDGEFRLYDSDKTVSKQSVSDTLNNLDELTKDNPELKKLLGNAKVMDEVPEKKDLEKIAKGIDDGVKKSTFSFQDFSFSGLLNMIANFIAAVFDWMTGKGGLWESFGKRMGDSAVQGVRSELGQLRAQDQKLQNILSEERLDAIDQNIRHQAMKRATGNNDLPAPKREVTLEETQVKEPGVGLDQKSVQALINAEIAHTINNVYFAREDNPDTKDVVEGTARKAVMDATWRKEKSANEVQAAFLKATEDVVQDPTTKTKSLDKIREDLAKRVGKELKWKFGESAIEEQIVKGEDGKTLLDDATVKKIKKSSELYHGGIVLHDRKNETQLADEHKKADTQKIAGTIPTKPDRGDSEPDEEKGLKDKSKTDQVLNGLDITSAALGAKRSPLLAIPFLGAFAIRNPDAVKRGLSNISKSSKASTTTEAVATAETPAVDASTNIPQVPVQTEPTKDEPAEESVVGTKEQEAPATESNLDKAIPLTSRTTPISTTSHQAQPQHPSLSELEQYTNGVTQELTPPPANQGSEGYDEMLADIKGVAKSTLQSEQSQPKAQEPSQAPTAKDVKEDVGKLIDSYFATDKKSTPHIDETGIARKKMEASGLLGEDDIAELQRTFKATAQEMLQDPAMEKASVETVREKFAQGVVDKIDWWQSSENKVYAALTAEGTKDSPAPINEELVEKLQLSATLYNNAINAESNPAQSLPSGDNKLVSSKQQSPSKG